MRATVEAMEGLLGETTHVLDDGFVRVVDYMGDDAAIVHAARVSYAEAKGSRHSNDRTLIRYLMRHRHTTPFEMCELKLHVRVPMDCWRQWIRHRTANVNETSTRYAPAIDSAQRTPRTRWRMQSRSNRQGSEDEFLEQPYGRMLSDGEARLHRRRTGDEYAMRLDAGIAREQARNTDLPLSTYTEAFWKIDLHNLLHFLGLRMDAHAQQEIREYAAVDRRHRLSLGAAYLGGIPRLPPQGVDAIGRAKVRCVRPIDPQGALTRRAKSSIRTSAAESGTSWPPSCGSSA